MLPDLENILHCFDVIAEWELVFSCVHAALHKIEYMIPLVPPIDFPIVDPISPTVSAASFRG